MTRSLHSKKLKSFAGGGMKYQQTQPTKKLVEWKEKRKTVSRTREKMKKVKIGKFPDQCRSSCYEPVPVGVSRGNHGLPRSCSGIPDQLKTGYLNFEVKKYLSASPYNWTQCWVPCLTGGFVLSPSSSYAWTSFSFMWSEKSIRC